MGSKSRHLIRRRKNRGHERLAKWRLFQRLKLAAYEDENTTLECSSTSRSCSSNSTVEVTKLDFVQTMWNEPQDEAMDLSKAAVLTLWDEPQDKAMDLSKAAVDGVMFTGSGLDATNVRCTSSRTYGEQHQEVCKSWEVSALKQMRMTDEEESAMSWTPGDVDRGNNIPVVKVETRSIWVQRTYSRKNCNTSGAVQFKPEMWEDEPEEKEKAEEQPPPVKRPRGRPRKIPVTTDQKVESSNMDKIDFMPCCALACTNTSETHTMNCLPRDTHLRQCWIKKIDRLYWTPDEDSALCEIHFEDKMWSSNAGDQKILKLNAIPTLFLHGEAIKSWVTLDNSSNDLVEIQDSNEVIEVSRSESEDEDPDIYVKREALEPQIDMVEGVEDVLSHNPDSSSLITSDGEQFETIYCDTTTFNGDEDSLEEPHGLHIKQEMNYDERLMLEENAGNPLEPDSFGEDSMNDSEISLIQDDQVTCLSEAGNENLVRKSGDVTVKSNYFVISQPSYSVKKPIRRRRSCQLTDEFQCPMCFKKLSRKKNLDIHMAKLHKNGELSEYQMMLRKNEALNGKEDGILRKQLEVKKARPTRNPNPHASMESSSPPLPALKPIRALKGLLSPSSAKISTTLPNLLPAGHNESSSSTPTLLITSTSSSLITTSSSMPTLLPANPLMSTLMATSSSMPTLLATSSSTPSMSSSISSNPTLLATHCSTPTLLNANAGNSTLLASNSNIPTLLATSSTTPTLIATSAVVATPCHNDPSPSGGRMQNQFLLLLPKPPNSSSIPFDQPMAIPDDSNYSIDLSKIPEKQREKLKEKIHEMIKAVVLKNLDPGRIIIAYDRT